MKHVCKGVFSLGKSHLVSIKISAEWVMEHSFIGKESHLSLSNTYSWSVAVGHANSQSVMEMLGLKVNWQICTHWQGQSWHCRDFWVILESCTQPLTKWGLPWDSKVMEEFCGCGARHCRCTFLNSSWRNFLTCSFAFKIGVENKAFRNF